MDSARLDEAGGTLERADSGPGPLDPVDYVISELELVYRFLYARVGSRADAEDLTQQVALKVIPRLRHGYPDSSIRAYLFAAARSVLAGHWSQRLRMPVEELRDWSRVKEPPAQAADTRIGSALAGLLQRLRPEHRRLLELRYLRGYTHREIARDMGKTTGAVKVMQRRALDAAAAAAPNLVSPGPAWL